MHLLYGFFRFVLFIAFENLCKYFFKSFLYYDKRYWEINKSQILIVAWAVNENKKTTQTNFITKYLQRDANNVFVRNEIFPWEDFFPFCLDRFFHVENTLLSLFFGLDVIDFDTDFDLVNHQSMLGLCFECSAVI